eukprot:8657867-Pyramimonas_sp.AAC.1
MRRGRPTPLTHGRRRRPGQERVLALWRHRVHGQERGSRPARRFLGRRLRRPADDQRQTTAPRRTARHEECDD